MDFSLLFPSLVFAVLGSFILFLLLWSLWNAFFGNAEIWGERARFKRRQETLKKADAAIRAGDFPAALRLIENSYFFDHVKTDLNLIERVLGHHIGALGRLVSIAEEQDRSLANLAVIEDLVHARGDLMRSYAEASTTRSSLEQNRKKPVPRWALDEYEKKMVEIVERLVVNRRSLASQFASAVTELRKPPGKSSFDSRDGEEQEDVTIH
jgi:hypothetical protein